MSKIYETWLDFKDWLRGNFWLQECPFCEHLAFSARHKCPTMAGMSDAEKISTIAAKVREVIERQPADRFIHDAEAALVNLETTWAGRASNSTPGKDGK